MLRLGRAAHALPCRRAWQSIRAASGLTGDERYLFDLQGYIVLKNVLSKEEVAQANAAIDRRKSEFVERGEDIRNAKAPAFAGENLAQGRLELGTHLTWPTEDSAIFRRMLAHPKVVPKLHDLVGQGYRLDHLPLLLIQRQGVEGFDLHGGAYAHDGAWNRALRYECHHGETHCNLLALSLQLTDTAAGDGGFVIVPGSHKANFPLPPSIQALKKHEHVLAQPALEAGDVLLFSEATTHGAVPWKGALEERRIALYRFTSATMAYGRGYLDSWPEALLADMTQAERAVLEPPYSRRLDRRVVSGDGAAAVPAPRDPRKLALDESIFAAPYF